MPELKVLRDQILHQQQNQQEGNPSPLGPLRPMVIVLLGQKAPTGALRSHCKLSGHLAARPSSFSRIKAKGDTQGPRARAIATSWRAYLEALDGLDPKLN